MRGCVLKGGRARRWTRAVCRSTRTIAAGLVGEAPPSRWDVGLTALRGPRALAEADCRRTAGDLAYEHGDDEEDEEDADELPAGESVASAWWSSDEGGMGMACDGRDWIRDLGDGRWLIGSSGDSYWRQRQVVPRPATDEAAADLILDLLGSNSRYSGAAAWALEPLDPNGTLSPQRREDLKEHVWQEPPAGVSVKGPDAVLQIVRGRLRESDHDYERARKALAAPADPESYEYFDSCNPFDWDLHSCWRAGDPNEEPEILIKAFESGERDLWERLRTNPAFGTELINGRTRRGEGVFTYLLEDPSTSDQVLADWAHRATDGEALTLFAGDRISPSICQHLAEHTDSDAWCLLAELLELDELDEDDDSPDIDDHTSWDMSGIRGAAAREAQRRAEEAERDAARRRAAEEEAARQRAEDEASLKRMSVSRPAPRDPRDLAADPDPQNREEAAWRPSAPADVVRDLAADPDPWVRAAVARRRHLPTSIIDALARDQSALVRRELAKNTHVDLSTAPDLADDPDEHVRKAVAARHEPPAYPLPADETTGA